MMEDTRASLFNMDFHLPSKGKIRMFDCTICGGSLEEPGPSLESFSFGKLLMSINQLSFSEQEVIYREFSMFDQCFSNGYYDCNKVLSTACGHLFHSGCIREWFFMRRLDRIRKCPFCNQRTNYDECWIIHATACNPDEGEDDDDYGAVLPIQTSDDKHAQLNNQAVPDYSDISCESSSFSSDGSDSDESATEDAANDDGIRADDDVSNTENENNDPTLPDYILQVGSGTQNDLRVPVPMYIDHSVESDSEGGILDKAFRFIDKCNIIHACLLRSTIRSVCHCYQERKTTYQQMLDDMEDDELVMEETNMIPLGYDFISQLLATGLIICSIEAVRKILRRK